MLLQFLEIQIRKPSESIALKASQTAKTGELGANALQVV